MIRAAAKNHRYVAVVVRPESYDAVLAELEEGDGEISAGTRHWLANEAFAATARYDAAISRWFGERYEDFPTHQTVSMEKFMDLSYGENPHQRAALYTEVGARAHVLSRVAKRHGKDLSFNNVLDLDSARNLLADLDGPACVIVKHNNPCGAAEGESALDAYEKALSCDPVSAFGGVIALNRPIDEELAERLHENFVEVLIAPGYEGEAMEILQQKEAIRILEDTEQRDAAPASWTSSGSAAALLVQELDGVASDREGDDGRDGRRAERGGVARHRLRLEGLQARPLQRDRLRQGPADDRDRRRADEPGRLGPAGGREVRTTPSARRPTPCSTAPSSPPTPSSRSPTARRPRSRPAPGRSSSPAARSGTSRSSRRSRRPASTMIFTGRRHFRH